MARAKKPALTRRLECQYRAVLDCDGSDYNHPWPHVGYSIAHANAMAAYFFAKRWRSRNIDIKALQRVIIRCQNPEAAFLFARDIEGASVRRLQKIILDHGSVKQKREFARDIPGASVQWLEAIADIQEVMEL